MTMTDFMTDIIPQIQFALLALYSATESQIKTMNPRQLDDLSHLADESRNNQQWTARAAAEIVSAAIQARKENL